MPLQLLPFVFGVAAGQAGGSVLGPIGEIAGQTVNFVAPVKIIDAEQVIDLFVTQRITLQDTKQLLARNGFFSWGITLAPLEPLILVGDNLVAAPTHKEPGGMSLTEEWISSKTGNPTTDEIVTLYYRKVIDRTAANLLFRRNGFPSHQLQDAYIKLGEQIPGPADLVRFAVREAFTPAIVQQYGYANELPTQILPWFEKQGLGGEIGLERPASIDANGNPVAAGKATWFDCHWWSHWELPSVGQAYEMTQRLYPTSSFGPSPDWTPEISFTPDDLSTLLKTQDYPTYWRKRLEAISYAPLTRVDVRRMFKLDILDEAGVYHAYRAVGYNDRNALWLLRFAQRDKADSLQAKARGFTVQKIIAYYKAGVISTADAYEKLKTLQIPETERKALIGFAEMEVNTERMLDAIKVLHKTFIEGFIDADELHALLVNADIRIDRVTNYVQKWKFERDYKHKHNSTAQLLQAFKLDIISVETLTERLFNLGYPAKEVSIIIRNSVAEKEDKLNQQIIRARKTQTQQLDKLGKQAEKQRKEVEKAEKAEQTEKVKRSKELQKEKEKAAKDTIADLLAPYSEKNLVGMFNADQITREQVAAILKVKQWNQTAINRWLETYLKPKNGAAKNAEPQTTE